MVRQQAAVVLDIWVVIGLSQVALIAVIAAGFFGWRWHALRTLGADLDTRCTEAEKALADGKKLLADAKGLKLWKAELETRIAALAKDAETTGPVEIRRRVLNHELSGKPLDLADCIATPSDPALQAELEKLRAELVTKQSTEAEAPKTAERERELKALVQQFTHDTREMLSCIQALESENKDLRSQVAATRNAA